MRKYISEFIGTAVLVLFGTGVAVLSSGNLVATSLAFGLAIVALAYVIGNVSGCHVNPAVSLAMFVSKKMSSKDFIWYTLFYQILVLELVLWELMGMVVYLLLILLYLEHLLWNVY